MAEQKRVLVTGGAGYIGSHTIISLLENGFDVVSADNYSNSSARTYDRIRSITGKEITHIEIDLCDQAAVRKMFHDFPGITGVIHFAAFKSVPESVQQPLLYYHNNINSLINILHEAGNIGIRDIIFSSSCSVYGNITSLPVSEHTPPGEAFSPYAYTKQVGETICRDFAAASAGFHITALRYFNPVGAHPSGLLGELPLNRPNNLVPVITQTAIGKIPSFTVFGTDYDTRDGTCIRDYIHVCDIAEAHVAAIKRLSENRQQLSYDVINLGSGAGVTVLEAIHAFEAVSGIKPNYVLGPRREGDVTAIYSDCTKAESELRWKPAFALDEMMRSAWKWEQHLASGS